MKTAEEMLCDSFGIEMANISDEESGLAAAIEHEYHRTTDVSRLKSTMIEFAKMHVNAALKAASQKAEVVMVSNCSDHTPYWGACVSCGRSDNPQVPTKTVNDESILSAYPLTNIK